MPGPRIALLVEPVPHRERDTEEPLTADAPVAVQTLDPRRVASAHVLGVPAELPAALEQLLAELDRLHEPLPARHDLERSLAALVELDGVADRHGLADEVAGRAEELGDRGPRLLRGQAPELALRRGGGGHVAR